MEILLIPAGPPGRNPRFRLAFGFVTLFSLNTIQGEEASRAKLGRGFLYSQYKPIMGRMVMIESAYLALWHIMMSSPTVIHQNFTAGVVGLSLQNNKGVVKSRLI
jgi:hypothetical protein